MSDAKPMSPERLAEIERDGWCFHTAAREKAQREMIAEIRRLQSAVERLANNERDLAETNLVLEQQDRDLERQRARITALEVALREACEVIERLIRYARAVDNVENDPDWPDLTRLRSIADQPSVTAGEVPAERDR